MIDFNEYKLPELDYLYKMLFIIYENETRELMNNVRKNRTEYSKEARKEMFAIDENILNKMEGVLIMKSKQNGIYLVI